MNTNREIRTVILERKHFHCYPAWTWSDGMESVIPVTEIHPTIERYVDLFIKAKFFTSVHVFDGYLMGKKYFYGFALFINGKKFMFNKNLKTINQQNLSALSQQLRSEHFILFPLQYRSEVTFHGNCKIEGTLEMDV